MAEMRILKLNQYECGAVFESLKDKRNALLKENKSTDTVDDALLKVIEVINKKEKRRNEAR